MKSVENIKKITSAMKMVAASKMRTAKTRTEQSRGMVKPLVRFLGDMPATAAEKNVTIPVSTDRGLCGGINSNLTKYTRGVQQSMTGDGKDFALVVLGEKCKIQLLRDQKDRFKMTIADVTKSPPTFAQIAQISDDILKVDFDAARIIYNRFVSALSFRPTVATILSPDTLEKNLDVGSTLDQYEVEGPDRSEMLLDLCEFNFATILYNAICENNCSEHASRMAAMESSTKNAKEMLDSLTLLYNRSRQATITKELIEIISGASALSEKA